MLPVPIRGLYRVLETIGEVGRGVIYMAEQREPVRHRVARKLIELGLDPVEVISRSPPPRPSRRRVVPDPSHLRAAAGVIAESEPTTS